jgi:hypothetical protein
MKMSNPKIEPEKITKLFQMLAVWMAGLVLISGSFISGAVLIKSPLWLSPFLCIGAFIIVVLFAYCMFTMQTKYRPQLQDDHYYAEYLKREAENFKGFKPENIISQPTEKEIIICKDESWEEREQRRNQVYENNYGLFLIHTWRPSHIEGQVADISISLFQHREGPLRKGTIKNVEYHLGPKFFTKPVVKTNRKDNYRLDVSAYGPMLCLARVNFKDETPSIDLERYINFS